MRIRERVCGDAVVLDMAGPIAGAKASAMIDEAIRRHGRAGARLVVANLDNVPSVDLAGLSALVDAYSTLRRAQGAMRLVGVTTRIDDLLVITRLLTVFDTFDSVQEAVGGATPTYSSRSESPLSAGAFGIASLIVSVNKEVRS